MTEMWGLYYCLILSFWNPKKADLAIRTVFALGGRDLVTGYQPNDEWVELLHSVRETHVGAYRQLCRLFLREFRLDREWIKLNGEDRRAWDDLFPLIGGGLPSFSRDELSWD